LGEIANHFLRQIDFKSAQNVDCFIANSQEVAGRIKKFYRRDSTVIYPPVEIPEVPIGIHSRGGNYYLTGGRLARPKRVDLAIKACTKLKLPLVVFGKEFAGYGDELHRLAGSTIDFVSEITDKAKIKLMVNAKAFIFPADQEDFGITPVEAMSAGCPVIAYRSGGVIESVVEGKTGVFFNEPTVASLIGAIKRFTVMKINFQDCVAQARKFSKARFEKEMLQFVDDHAQKIKN